MNSSAVYEPRHSYFDRFIISSYETCPVHSPACNTTSNCLLKDQFYSNNCTLTYLCQLPVSSYVHSCNEREVTSNFINQPFHSTNLHNDEVEKPIDPIVTRRATYFRYKIFVGSLDKNVSINCFVYLVFVLCIFDIVF